MISIQDHLEICRFDRSDIQGLIDLSESVGWDYDRREIDTVLASGAIFGHKNVTGTIVSSAAIITYDSYIASIGMVIVNPNYRGIGLAKEVTKRCMDLTAQHTKVMLISTDEGKPLYERLEFKTVDFVHKYISNKYVPLKIANAENITIENVEERDLEEIIQLDAAAFGDQRGQFLMTRINQAEQSLVARNEQGEKVGFGLSILGSENLSIGPIVAADSITAIRLIHELARLHKGNLRIDVPANTIDHIKESLQQSGFKKVRTPELMINNADQMPQRNGQLYAIAAQIFG